MLRSILDLQATLMWASGLGVVRIEDLVDYTANGKVVNLASRLCDEAGNGQILVNSKTCIAIEDQVEVEKCEDLDLKGFSKPVVVYDLKRRNTAELYIATRQNPVPLCNSLILLQKPLPRLTGNFA